MVNEIAAWLNDPDRDFSEGLKIFNEYKRNGKFDKFFSIENPSRNSMHFKMLIQQISNIYRKILANPSLIKVLPIKVSEIDTKKLQQKFNQRVQELNDKRPRIFDHPIVDVKELPQDLQKLYFENKSLVKQRAGFHLQAKKIDESSKNNDKRKKICDEICIIDDHIATNWKQIDDWWKDNNTEKDQETIEPVIKLTDKVKKINNLNNYIDRANRRIRSFPEEKEKLEPKIAKWQAELTELTKE